MTIEDFWNQAFLAALARLPAEEAKKEADKAMSLCLQYWQSLRFRRAQATPWKDQDIATAPPSDI